MQHVIAELRRWDGPVNSPATDDEIDALRACAGAELPDDLVELYRHQNGWARALRRGDGWLPVRLMPVAEVIDFMANLRENWVMPVDLLWCWTDDNSNYVAAYMSKPYFPMSGFAAIVNHDEPDLSPAFTSIRAFLSTLLESMRGDSRRRPCDAVTIPQELPVMLDESERVDALREHGWYFFNSYELEREKGKDEDRRTFLAFCAMRLLPVEDTPAVGAFLEDPSDFIAERAVQLLHARNHYDAVPRLVAAARSGRGNVVSAVARCLADWHDVPGVSDAVETLRRSLDASGRQILEQWTRRLPR